MRINIIPENIGEYLAYDETSPTGLRWIKKICSASKINIGNPAGSFNNRTNYYQTKFDGKYYYNHRIIFFLHNGYCPSCIDHIDGDRTNNKIDNLREATRSQNNWNRKFVNNTSGHKGICLHSTGKYWHVRIKKNNKCVISKIFPISKFQAACNYADEQRQILHGEFSNNGENYNVF